VAAVVNDDSPSSSTTNVSEAMESGWAKVGSLCGSKQLKLSIRASGFGAHVAALRLSGTEPCDVGKLHVSAWVVGRNGQPVLTKVAPPQQFAGQINPGEELIAGFDYTMPCRQRGPFSATVVVGGRDSPVRATAPVAFRRDPLKSRSC
jgi:hypothetical protein